MTLRRVLFAIMSLLVALLLALLLVRIGKIDLASTVRQLRHTPAFVFINLVLLNMLLVLISTEKWRSVDAALRDSADAVPSWRVAYCVTSLGLALGLILPVQLGMTAARTIGIQFYGRALRRGVAGTLVEQSFDVFLLFFLALATAATLAWKGGELMWSILAAAMILVCVVIIRPLMRSVSHLTKVIAIRLRDGSFIGTKVKRLSMTFEQAVTLRPGLGIRLLTLSVVRFAVVVAMARETAVAIGAQIPLWQIAAMVPFVVVAMLLAITPGGFGFSELTSVGVLRLFGTPLAVSAQWAVANRVLATISCFVIAAGSVLVLTVRREDPGSVSA